MQPSQTDIISGLDPTSLQAISGAQLETMVGGAIPFTDKGIVMVTTDASLNSPNVPAAQTTTKWQTYLWIRIQPSNAAVSLYAWNPNGGSDPTFLQWQNITLSSIPSGSIQGYQLAPSTVTSDKILNIQLSQIVGYQSLLTTVLTPTVQTQISGSYALGFTINNGVVSLAMLDQTGLAGQVLLANGVGSAPTWNTKQILTGLPNPDAVSGANDGQVVAVNSGAAGTFEYLYKGRIIQQVVVSDVAKYSYAGTLASTTTAPNYNSTGMVNISGLNTTFTPLSAASTIVVEAIVLQACNGVGYTYVGIFNGTGATAPLAGNATLVSSGITLVNQIVVMNSYQPGSITPIAFKVAFGVSTSGHAYINSLDGSTALFGGVPSYLKITEYL